MTTKGSLGKVEGIHEASGQGTTRRTRQASTSPGWLGHSSSTGSGPALVMGEWQSALDASMSKCLHALNAKVGSNSWY